MEWNEKPRKFKKEWLKERRPENAARNGKNSDRKGRRNKRKEEFKKKEFKAPVEYR